MSSDFWHSSFKRKIYDFICMDLKSRGCCLRFKTSETFNVSGSICKLIFIYSKQIFIKLKFLHGSVLSQATMLSCLGAITLED
jgi:hypothetical protein